MNTEKKDLSKWIIESDFEKFLFPFLSPTSEGTHYWEGQPSGELTERQIGRIILQLHQLVERINKTKFDDNISFLDIGTGNGLIPRLLPYFMRVKVSHGCDPFLDGEHQTSFQKHDRNKEFQRIIGFLKKSSKFNGILNFDNYSLKTSNEHFYGKPAPIELNNFDKNNEKFYKFFQVGAHNLEELNGNYNYLYCKAIEHINDWGTIFEKAFKTSSENAIFYLKHKSFFSYLGAHRYASTGLPWGHLRMKESEFDDYVKELIPERNESIRKFFYKGLAYPRNTIGEMISIASSFGWRLGSVEYERSKNIQSFQNILFANNGLIYKEIKKNYDVSVDELLSGLIHIIFTK